MQRTVLVLALASVASATTLKDKVALRLEARSLAESGSFLEHVMGTTCQKNCGQKCAASTDCKDDSCKNDAKNCDRLNGCDWKKKKDRCEGTPITSSPTTTPPTSSPTTARPTASPTTAPPTASGTAYEATATTYYPNDTAGTSSNPAGACGGSGGVDLAAVASKLGKLSISVPYFAIAPSQSMLEPMECVWTPYKSDGTTCTNSSVTEGQGCPSETGDCGTDVLHLYCGQCVEISTTIGGTTTTLGGVVLDVCPATSTNSEWCTSGCAKNDQNVYNHVDVFGSSENAVKQYWNGEGTTVAAGSTSTTVTLVTCPTEVTDALEDLGEADDMGSDVCFGMLDFLDPDDGALCYSSETNSHDGGVGCTATSPCCYVAN